MQDIHTHHPLIQYCPGGPSQDDYATEGKKGIGIRMEELQLSVIVDDI